MHVVVNLEALQDHGIASEDCVPVLNYLSDLLSERQKHEITIAVNGHRSADVEFIRGRFQEVLSQDRIRSWYAGFPPGHLSSAREPKSVNESAKLILRNTFLQHLSPDCVLIPGVSDIACWYLRCSTSTGIPELELASDLETEVNSDGHKPIHAAMLWKKISAGVFPVDCKTASTGGTHSWEPLSILVSNLSNSNSSTKPALQLAEAARQRGYRPTLVAVGSPSEIKCDFPVVALRHFLAQLDMQANTVYLLSKDGCNRELLTACRFVPGVVVLNSEFTGREVVVGSRWTTSTAIVKTLHKACGYPAVLTFMSRRKIDEVLDRHSLIEFAVGDNPVVPSPDAETAISFPESVFDQIGSKLGSSSTYQIYCAALALARQESTACKATTLSFATALHLNLPAKKKYRQIFLDVTGLAEGDYKTGIQRVVRHLTSELLQQVSSNLRVEPIRATRYGYVYAKRYTASLMGIAPSLIGEDEPIEPSMGDLFLGLDLQLQTIVDKVEYLQHLRNLGVRVGVVVYDLLPIQMPQYFETIVANRHPTWLSTSAKLCDFFVCISETVSQEASAWIEPYLQNRRRPLKLYSFRLGSDIAQSNSQLGNNNLLRKVQNLDEEMTFLMVGTIEPRKAHSQVLSAFDLLWSKGFNFQLILAGKEGWLVNDLVRRICNHPNFGKKLRWIEHVPDAELDALYRQSHCLIFPSFGEGFGLPIVEGAARGLPVIARDLPVFREIAGDGVTYFSGFMGSDLAAAVEQWYQAFRDDRHIKPKSIDMLTWKQSAQQLLEILNSETRSAVLSNDDLIDQRQTDTK